MVSFDYTFLVASIAITVVSAGYHVSPPPPPPPPPPPSPTPVSTDCFTLSAHYTNGTRAGFLYLFDDAGFVDGALTDSEAAAAKLALDTSSQRLIDYESAPGHNGLIAATYQNPGFYSAVFFKTYEELQGITDYIALQCELSSSGILSCNHPLNSTNFFQTCCDGGLAFTSTTISSTREPVTFSAVAATGCTAPTTTISLPSEPMQPTPGPPQPLFLCTGEKGAERCIDDFLVECYDEAVGANVSWYIVPRSTSEYTCHKRCVADPTCTGWRSYYEEIDLRSCYHTQDTFSPNTTFRFDEYFFSVGVRGFCP